MVRAILDGRKTQTRRVMKLEVEDCQVRTLCSYRQILEACPYGQPGDQLWVRETFRVLYDPATCLKGALDIDYRANGEDRIADRLPKRPAGYKWRPSIHMPRWASRITLGLTAVRVERLREMTNEDAQAEGIEVSMDEHSVNLFADFWDSINGKTYPWASNPWVWVLTFRRA